MPLVEPWLCLPFTYPIYWQLLYSLEFPQYNSRIYNFSLAVHVSSHPSASRQNTVKLCPALIWILLDSELHCSNLTLHSALATVPAWLFLTQWAPDSSGFPHLHLLLYHLESSLWVPRYLLWSSTQSSLGMSTLWNADTWFWPPASQQVSLFSIVSQKSLVTNRSFMWLPQRGNLVKPPTLSPANK